MKDELNQIIFRYLLRFCVDFVLRGSYVSWNCYTHDNSDHVQMLAHIYSHSITNWKLSCLSYLINIGLCPGEG